MGAMLVILGVGIVGIIIAIVLLSAFEKSQKKQVTNNKDKVEAPILEQPKPQIKEYKVEAEQQKTYVKEENKQDEYAEKSVRFQRHQSIRDYHKNRWSAHERNVESIDDITPSGQGGLELDEDDVKKLLALEGLFAKKE